jgi:hypothetical protein
MWSPSDSRQNPGRQKSCLLVPFSAAALAQAFGLAIKSERKDAPLSHNLDNNDVI